MYELSIAGETGPKFISCYYDALTKCPAKDGIFGILKITQIVNKFNEVAIYDPAKDEYTDLIKEYVVLLEDDEYNLIKEGYARVTWNAMKHELIATSYAYLLMCKQSTLEVVK